jgi:hypothetical protein
MTWRLHREVIEATAVRTFARIFSLLKIERLSADIKLTLQIALIISVMTYACPAWDLATDTLQIVALTNKVLRITGNFPKCTPVRDLHMDFNLPYVYNYVTKL